MLFHDHDNTKEFTKDWNSKELSSADEFLPRPSSVLSLQMWLAILSSTPHRTISSTSHHSQVTTFRRLLQIHLADQSFRYWWRCLRASAIRHSHDDTDHTRRVTNRLDWLINWLNTAAVFTLTEIKMIPQLRTAILDIRATMEKLWKQDNQWLGCIDLLMALSVIMPWVLVICVFLFYCLYYLCYEPRCLI